MSYIKRRMYSKQTQLTFLICRIVNQGNADGLKYCLSVKINIAHICNNERHTLACFRLHSWPSATWNTSNVFRESWDWGCLNLDLWFCIIFAIYSLKVFHSYIDLAYYVNNGVYAWALTKLVREIAQYQFWKLFISNCIDVCHQQQSSSIRRRQ